MNATSPIANDRLIYDAVHEFQTPLTVIREFASILEDGLCAPGVVTAEECVQAIRGASRDLLEMFDSFRIVATARFDAATADRRPFALTAIWEEIGPALAQRADERGARLEVAFDPTAALLADPRQVARALRGIVREAIRSTPSGGRVLVWARRRSKTHLAIGCLDGSPGLSPEDVRLFEQGEFGKGLERRSRICTFGLDLELARVVAGHNGGRLRLRTGPGGGRACLLLLPFTRAAASVDGSREPRRRVENLGSSR